MAPFWPNSCFVLSVRCRLNLGPVRDREATKNDYRLSREVRRVCHSFWERCHALCYCSEDGLRARRLAPVIAALFMLRSLH